MKPEYWDRAKRALARRDPVMAGIIRRHPRVHLVSRGDPFHTLARSIVGQQISVKAAQSVWNRFSGIAGDVVPERILQMKATQLRACGLSERKVEYISDLARRFDVLLDTCLGMLALATVLSVVIPAKAKPETNVRPKN